jgi:hypothetical protein
MKASKPLHSLNRAWEEVRPLRGPEAREDSRSTMIETPGSHVSSGIGNARVRRFDSLFLRKQAVDRL